MPGLRPSLHCRTVDVSSVKCKTHTEKKNMFYYHYQLILEEQAKTKTHNIFPFFITFHSSGEQGWRSGESARLPPMCPGFNSRSQCHNMWVEYVVDSRPCSVLRFSSLHKNQHFQIPIPPVCKVHLIIFIWKMCHISSKLLLLLLFCNPRLV